MCNKLPCNCSCEMYRAANHEVLKAGPPGGWVLDVIDGDHLHPVMWIKLPYNHVLPFDVYTGSAQKVETPSWLWDGNHDRPTLSPSLLIRTSRRDRATDTMVPIEVWHGYARDGILVSCPQLDKVKRRG